MFKVILSFLLVVCYLQCSFAAPYLFKQEVNLNNEELSNEVEESLKKLSYEVEKSIQPINDNWIFNNTRSIIRIVLEDSASSFSSWVLDILFRTELLQMINGNHLVFPLNDNPQVERDYKTIAVAVFKLMTNLNTMERTDKVITNSTRSLLRQHPEAVVNMIPLEEDEQRLREQYSEEEELKKLLYRWFKLLHQQLEADEELNIEYEQRIIEAEEIVKNDPSMRVYPKLSKEYSFEEVLEYLDTPTFRQAFVNKMFLKQTVKHLSMVFSQKRHKRYLIARALRQKAVSSGSKSKINDLYQKALVQAAQFSIKKKHQKLFLTVLFDAIENLLKKDPTLNEEIRVLMEKIDAETVYNTDMLHVDFSIL